MKTYLEPKDIMAMENEAKTLRDQLLIRLLFYTGCRISEAINLEVEDIDFELGTISIVHLKRRVKISCASCGARLGISHIYCPKCGARIDEAT
jgi:integrase/recombinase XerD